MQTFSFNLLDVTSFDEIYEHIKKSYIYNYGEDDFKKVERKLLNSSTFEKDMKIVDLEPDKHYFTAKDLKFIANKSFFFAGRNKSMLVAFIAGKYWVDTRNINDRIISSEHMRQIGIQLYRLY